MFGKLLKMASEVAEEPGKSDNRQKTAALLAEAEKLNAQYKGIKEITEVIEALTLATVFLAKRIKDGFGADDAMALMQKMVSDPEFIAVIARASDGINEVRGELSELDFEESITLGALGLEFVRKVVKELNG